jgi:hypothetical protein
MLWMVINQSLLLGVKPISLLVTKYLFSSEIYVFTVLGTISDERLDLSITCLSLSVIHIYIF